MAVKIAIIGAGSRSFGPAVIRDIFLSDILCDSGVELSLMDIVGDNLLVITRYADFVMNKLHRKADISNTTDLETALGDADFVICAVERAKFHYWAQDYHIPRKYGFKQVFGAFYAHPVGRNPEFFREPVSQAVNQPPGLHVGLSADRSEIGVAGPQNQVRLRFLSGIHGREVLPMPFRQFRLNFRIVLIVCYE